MDSQKKVHFHVFLNVHFVCILQSKQIFKKYKDLIFLYLKIKHHQYQKDFSMEDNHLLIQWTYKAMIHNHLYDKTLAVSDMKLVHNVMCLENQLLHVDVELRPNNLIFYKIN